MQEYVARVAPLAPGSGLGQGAPAQTSETPRAAPPSTPVEPGPADYRLVIEEVPGAHTFVYKTLDRRTGEVVSQAPREEVLKLRERDDYQAGDLIATRA